MALTDFKPQFDNSYQETFLKTLVGKSIANMRFEALAKVGESVERVAYDTSGVRVRSTVRGNPSTIDTITDSSELLLVNIEKEAVFHISDGEATQAGSLNPGEQIGAEIAHKVSQDLDARILYETKSALLKFDTGDLTTGVSTGVPFSLSSTTVPQMTTRMAAKLATNNQVLTNLVWVVDPYIASDIEQYLMGKSIDLAGFVFKNGYSGPVRNADLYISNNLTGEAVLTFSSGLATDGDTITIGGVVFTLKTSLSSGPAIAGEVVLGANFAATITNLAAAINAPGTTTSTFTALSAADQAIIAEDLKLAATGSATTLTVVGTGSGRLIISESATNVALTYNFIHSYYGKKGGIDVVVQNFKKVDMRPTDDRRGTNVFNSYLAGIKTFADGAKKFLDVKISV
jgi:hypothetical protein